MFLSLSLRYKAHINFTMKLHRSLPFFKSTIIALLFCSCASDIDFNQTKNFTIKPVFVANLAYFENKENTFIDNELGQSIVFDAQDFDVFRNAVLRDNLMKVNFSFEIDNTISRDFTINFDFLDVNNKIVHNTEINIPAHFEDESQIIKYNDNLENQSLSLLKKSVKIEIRITMLPASPLIKNNLGSLKLRSGATLYFEF